MENVNKLIEQAKLKPSKASDYAELGDPRFTADKPIAIEHSYAVAVTSVDLKYSPTAAALVALPDPIAAKSPPVAVDAAYVVALEPAAV